jgi:1,4-alpha-glucan branching enzyme
LGEELCQFRVWAPEIEQVELHLWAGDTAAPGEPGQLISKQRRAQGYHQVTVKNVKPGSRYLYRLNGREEWSGPASRFQPEGVHSFFTGTERGL